MLTASLACPQGSLMPRRGKPWDFATNSEASAGPHERIALRTPNHHRLLERTAMSANEPAATPMKMTHGTKTANGVPRASYATTVR